MTFTFQNCQQQREIYPLQELYRTPFDCIHWPAQRNHISKADLYTPHPFILDLSHYLYSLYDSYVVPLSPHLRKRGVKRAYELICMEDENTAYQCSAPVSKPLHMICRLLQEGPNCEALRLHREKIRDFMWLSNTGLFCQGTNGELARRLAAWFVGAEVRRR